MKNGIWIGRKLLNMKTGLSGVFLIWSLVILSPYSQIVRGESQASNDQPNVTKSYEAHAERIEEMFKWGIGGVFTMFSLVSAFQIINAQYVRDEIRKGQNNITEAVKKSNSEINEAVYKSKSDITKSAEKTEGNLANFLSLGHQALLKTIDLNEASIRLTREITDLDEPSIHHPLPATDQAVIAYYLEAVITQRDKLEKVIQKYSADIPTLKRVGSIMDWRTIGKAKHYVGEYKDAIDAFGTERDMIENERKEAERIANERIYEAERKYMEAIEPFGKKKDMKENERSEAERIAVEKVEAEQKRKQNLLGALRQDLCKSQLHLGHSHAGLNDYPKAMFWYEKIDKYQTFRDLNVQLPLSKAHAYRDMEKFEKALEQCKEACTNSGLSEMSNEQILSPRARVRAVTVRCYWEAMYEKANCHTAKGEYPDAAELYKKAIELYEALPSKGTAGDFGYAGALIWLYVSYGDCLFKQWKADTFKAQCEYEKSLRKVDSEIPYDDRNHFKGPILYRLGRLHVSNGNLQNAEKVFRKIEDNGYDMGFDKYLFEIFYGYSLLHVNKDNDEKKKSGREKINSAVNGKEDELKKKKERLKGKGDDYNYEVSDPSYHLAMGWAMQDDEDKTRAIELLEELTTPPYKFDAVKAWAQSADCADFPELRLDPRFRKVVDLPKLMV